MHGTAPEKILFPFFFIYFAFFLQFLFFEHEINSAEHSIFTLKKAVEQLIIQY